MRLAERLGALDRRRGGRVDGDHEEVLAAVGLLEARVPLGADRQLGGALEAEVGLRVRVGEVVGDLAALEQHVERHDGRAGLEDPVVDDREVGQVGAAQRDLVAGLDAARDEQVGDLVGGAVDLGVGQPGVAEDDGLAVRRRLAESSSSEERFGMAANLLSGRDARHRVVSSSGARGEDPAGLAQVGRDRPSRPAARRRRRARPRRPARDLALGDARGSRRRRRSKPSASVAETPRQLPALGPHADGGRTR